MSKYAALIEKLEKATGPDREIDVEIALAIGWEDDSKWEPRYTSSIEAALTLVPPDWSWRVGNLPSGRGFADLGTQPSLQCVEGASPPIALCIAALRAREG